MSSNATFGSYKDKTEVSTAAAATDNNHMLAAIHTEHVYAVIIIPATHIYVCG